MYTLFEALLKTNEKESVKIMSTLAKIAEIYYGNGCFTAFDLETTGLDAKRDRIVEIGAIKFDKTGIIARFSTLINPGIPMPPGASAVNNISDSMLKNQPFLDEVLPDFLTFIKDAVLIAHNAPFDCGFVNESLKIHFNQGKKSDGGHMLTDSLSNRIADTIALAKEAFPGLRRYNLQDLAVSLEIKAKEAHRATDDARVCMEIFTQCMEKIAKQERR